MNLDFHEQQRQADHYHKHRDASAYESDKASVSRRSVDWRDSGIVIDEDHQLNSMEGICDLCPSLGVRHTGISSAPRTSVPLTLDHVSLGQDDDGDTILHLAVVGSTLEIVKDLIKICDLDTINNMMQTPLHVATMANRPQMVKVLITSGAKLSINDRRGNTPLHLACQKGFRDIVTVILDSLLAGDSNEGLSIRNYLDMTNFEGQACLHLAASQDRRDVIELLVNKYKADLNCRDSRSGETVLHKAISMFNVDLVTFLLSLDQHCNAADYSGRTPMLTIRLLQASRIDQVQAKKLEQIAELVNNRCQLCTIQNGCCAGSIQSNEMLDSSSSSSDYSDSDTDTS